MTRSRRTYLTTAVATVALAAMPLPPAQAAGPNVVTQGAASWLEGPQRIQPAQGTAGTTNAFPFRPYNLPGEFINETKGTIEGQPFFLAYANRDQPVQTSDWWSSAGLQWSGWIAGNDPRNPVVRTFDFVSEPFQYQFIDLPVVQQVAGLDLPVYGLRLWNPAEIVVSTAYIDVKDIPSMIFGRGAIADQRSAIVTVGLQGVHPIRPNDGAVPRAAPWTNVRIKSYTDWGVEMAYADGGSELTATMVNGSPFTWFERTAGAAPFRVWAGMDDADPNGQISVWYNQDGVLGITVATSYVAPTPKNPIVVSVASYAVYTDQGSWTRQVATKPNAHMELYGNDAASKLVVAALPHNVNQADTTALTAALQDFQTFAWQRISDTRVHYPPIVGSNTSVTIDGQPAPLGYDAANSVPRTQMEVTTEDFKTGDLGIDGPKGTAMQIVFPHQRKAMIAQDRQNIPLVNGTAKYTWRSINGELQAYIGNSYVIPLASLLQVKKVSGAEQVDRYNNFPVARVQGSAAPGFSSSDAIGAMEQVASEVLPADHAFVWTGAAFEEKKSGGTTSMRVT